MRDVEYPEKEIRFFRFIQIVISRRLNIAHRFPEIYYAFMTHRDAFTTTRSLFRDIFDRIHLRGFRYYAKLQKDLLNVYRLGKETVTMSERNASLSPVNRMVHQVDLILIHPLLLFLLQKITSGESITSRILLANIRCYRYLSPYVYSVEKYIAPMCISANTTWRLSKIISRYKLQLLRNARHRAYAIPPPSPPPPAVLPRNICE